MSIESDHRDRLVDMDCEVVESRDLAPGYRYIGLKSLSIAEGARPGHFVNVRCGEGAYPLLRRPISIASVDRSAGIFWLLVKSVGRGSEWLTRVPRGARLQVLGPLGNSFTMPAPGDRTILVGGGVGLAPMLMLAEEIARVTKDALEHAQPALKQRPVEGLCAPEGRGAASVCKQASRPLVLLGAASAEGLLLRDEFERFSEVRLATDDGSCGLRGFVTQLLEDALVQEMGPGAIRASVASAEGSTTGTHVAAPCGDGAREAGAGLIGRLPRQEHGLEAATATPMVAPCGDGAREAGAGASGEPHERVRVYTCGPKPMMRKVAAMAISAGAWVEVSMEQHMACGLGACLVCVCATKAEGYGKYKRVCADGPIFGGNEVDWDA